MAATQVRGGMVVSTFNRGDLVLSTVHCLRTSPPGPMMAACRTGIHSGANILVRQGLVCEWEDGVQKDADVFNSTVLPGV